MDSFTGTSGNSQRGSSSSISRNNFEFDFGLGSNFSNRNTYRPLKDQKNPVTSSYSSSSASSSTSKPAFSSSSSSSTSWAPKTSWTHQPAPNAAPRFGPSNPTSMAGDILGKTWASAAPSTGIGILKSDPNLFGDLVGSALGQGKSSANVPLKTAPPRNSYSMGNLADSLPKTSVANTPMKPTSWGSAENLGSYSSSVDNPTVNNTGNPLGGNHTIINTGNPVGGPSMRSATAATNAKKDPFGSLMGFGSKPSVTTSPSTSSNSHGSSSSDHAFGTFGNSSSSKADSLGTFQNASSSKMDSFAAFQNASSLKMDNFGMRPAHDFTSQKQQSSQDKGGADPLDMLFSSSGSSAPATAASASSGSQPFAEANDWELGSEFGGNDAGSSTTELEGLPPPPAGVTASVAKSKGLDNYKQGQYADAIKWLSWAVVLLEKSGDSSASTEVLSCRASCYKEVGEYKKAVADCSKVLEHDSTNVSVLLQRALLYESTEKYKLGAEDLRAVLKIDSGNRLARSTIHRLTKLSG